jgi:DMSO/TMAO reductase YedYZ heme-binding membrane subunit
VTPELSPAVWWYVTRASGLVAWALLAGTLLWGVALSTRLLGDRPRAPWLTDLHRGVAGLACAFTGLHLVALVADSFVHFDVVDLLVPLASEWRPVPVALGVVGLWGLVAVQATSLARRRLSKRAWHRVHLTSYATLWLVSLHAALAGTDTTNPVVRVVAITTLALVLFATTYRAVGGNRKPPRPTRPAPATTTSPPVSDHADTAVAVGAPR